MYLDFFGFSAAPFELTPDPHFLYLPAGHREALSTLQYAVISGKGLTVLTGEAGLGKTTVLRTAIERLHGVATRVITISNPALTRPEFIEVIARSLDGEPVGASKPAVLAALESALKRDHDNGTRSVLVADEAHVMPDELLEEIRLLGNFETATAKLLSIILVGQPELAGRLNQPSLRQLKQRVALRCTLVPFSAAETAAYIATRLGVVGRSASDVFLPEAVASIHSLSRGIPRVINVLCDNALLTAFAADQRRVDARTVDEVRKDFDLQDDAPVSDDAGAEAAAAQPAPPAPRRPLPAPAQSKTSPAIRRTDMTSGGHVAAEIAAPRPELASRQTPPHGKAVVDRDSGLFKIYTRRKGFFSRVFS